MNMTNLSKVALLLLILSCSSEKTEREHGTDTSAADGGFDSHTGSDSGGARKRIPMVRTAVRNVRPRFPLSNYS